VSKGPENTFIASVHRHLPVSLYRMKNHNQYNGGIADCWYSGGGGDVWVEYKHLVLPKRADTMLDFMDVKKPYALSCLQQEWLRGRHAEGRRVWVIVGCKQGGVLLSCGDWERPISTLAFSAALRSRQDLAHQIVEATT
jgi:hypothetical protein